MTRYEIQIADNKTLVIETEATEQQVAHVIRLALDDFNIDAKVTIEGRSVPPLPRVQPAGCGR